MSIRTIEIRDPDILSPSTAAMCHTGNVCFTAMLNARLETFLACRSRAQKSRIVVQFVESIEAAGGRFLRRIEGNNGFWEEADGKTARRKVTHSFRNVLKMRRSDYNPSTRLFTPHASFSEILSRISSQRLIQPTVVQIDQDVTQETQNQNSHDTVESSMCPVPSNRTTQSPLSSVESQRPSLASRAVASQEFPRLMEHINGQRSTRSSTSSTCERLTEALPNRLNRELSLQDNSTPPVLRLVDCPTHYFLRVQPEMVQLDDCTPLPIVPFDPYQISQHELDSFRDESTNDIEDILEAIHEVQLVMEEWDNIFF